MPAIHGLIGPFDLDRDRGLALFADGDLFVVAFDGLAVVGLVGGFGNGLEGGGKSGGMMMGGVRGNVGGWGLHSA